MPGHRARFLAVFLVVFSFGLATNALANTAPFRADRGFLFGDGIGSATSGNEISALLQNPAALVCPGQEARLEAAQDFFGFGQMTAGYLLTIYEVTFGFGYYSFGTNDIQRVSATGATRPQVLGTFSNRYDDYMLSASSFVDKNLKFGLAGHLLRQTLDSDSAQAFVADFGIVWDSGDTYWLGAYTQNFFQTNYQWQQSGLLETLDRSVVAEGGMRFDALALSGATTFGQHRLAAEYDFNSILKLAADGVFSSSLGLQRSRYGLILNLGSLALTYARLRYASSNQDLLVDQDQLGLLLSLK